MKTFLFILAIVSIPAVAIAQATQPTPNIDVNPAAWLQILRFGIAGGIVAFVLDLHAWSKSAKGETYDWQLMTKRVVGGITGNILAGMGVTAVTGGVS